jgi:hypothetical protein
MQPIRSLMVHSWWFSSFGIEFKQCKLEFPSYELTLAGKTNLECHSRIWPLKNSRKGSARWLNWPRDFECLHAWQLHTILRTRCQRYCESTRHFCSYKIPLPSSADTCLSLFLPFRIILRFLHVPRSLKWGRLSKNLLLQILKPPRPSTGRTGMTSE